MRKLVLVGLLTLTTVAHPMTSFAVCCYKNGSVNCLGSPIQYNPGQPNDDIGGSLCGVTITGGAGCTLQILQGVTSTTNTDCLTIGRGVKVEGGAFFCDNTSGNCGTAVTVNSTGSGTASVDDVYVSGNRAWSNALVNNSGGNATTTGAYILGVSGTGISRFTSITDAYVWGCSRGVYLTSNGTSITDSSIYYSGDVGIEVAASNTHLVNGFVGYNNQNFATGATKIDSQGSAILAGWGDTSVGSNGNCGNGTWYDVSCLTFSGGRTTFVEDGLGNVDFH